MGRWLLCCSILLLFVVPFEVALAAASGYSFSSTLRPYTPLSGSTTQVLNPGDDDILSAAQSIGFSFVYDGVAYTQFKVSSNGFLTFNVAQTSPLSTNGLGSNVLELAPLWDDLIVDATGKVHFQVAGSAPNRVLTVEFLNMRWSKLAASANASFQIKLYEGSNKIEFVYGVFGSPNFASASIGISDILANSSSSSFSTNHFLSVTPGSPSTASATAENTTVSSLPEFGSGTVYTFAPPAPISSALLTVGASGTYASIQAAFDDLRSRGVATAVTVRILSDYVPETPANGITLDYIPGMNAANSVSLVVAAGVSKTVSIPNASGVDYAVRLRGMQYLTIDGSAGTLTIQSTGTNPSSAVKLMDGVQNTLLKGLILQAEGSTSATANAVVNFSSSNANNNVNVPNSNNRLLQCTISKATLRCANGILFSSGTAAPPNDGNRVDSSTVTDWGVGTGVAQAAIVLGRGYSNTVVADNEIFMTANVPSYATQAGLLFGIFANDVSTSFSILRNRIHDINPNTAVTTPTVKGLRVFANAASPASLVANNFITLDATVTTLLGSGGTLYGITDDAAGTTNYYYNSIRIGGNQSTGSGSSAAFDRPSTGVTTLRNNIFYNARTNSGTATGKHYAVRRSSSSGTFSSNYNDLFVDGAGGVIGFTTVDQTSLANWRTATAQDANSSSVNPSFTSALDHHALASSLVESRGIPVAGVSTDKDGESRNATWPDLGADEFSGAAPGAFSLSSPANNATAQPVNGTLRWASSARAGGFDVYIDTLSPPAVLVSSNQFDTSYSYSTLRAGAVYYWSVRARNAVGQTDPVVTPFTFTTANVPAAPTNLAMTSVTSAAITLTWSDNATTETGYRVYRATSAGGAFTQTGADQAANSVTFTNSGLLPNTHYYYKVVAFNASGESNPTSVRDTLTMANTPNAPTLTAISFTSMTVILDSTLNPSSTQFAILETGTNLYVQANGTLGASPVWQTYTQWGRASGIAVTGLTRATAYTFRAKARNDIQVETPLGASAVASTVAPIATFPYAIDFEGTSDSLWTTAKNPSAAIPSPANDWARGTFTKLAGAFSGSKAWVTKLAGTYSSNHLASLVSPEFNFSAFTKAPTISFWHNLKSEIYQDAGAFEYSTDGGVTWVRLGVKNDTNGGNWYNNDSTGPGAPVGAPNWTSTTSGWKNATYVPAVLVGKPLVQFRFRFGSDIFNSDSGWAVDKFQIIPPVAKDIRVVSVSLTQPRMVNYPITVTAKLRNMGSEANPGSVPLTYKKTTAPTAFGDVGGVSQTFSPVWSGDSATVTFTTAYTPTATGSLKMYVRSFYSGDQLATNDSTSTTVNVNPDGLYFAEDFESTTFPPTGWSVLDANGDGFTWSRKTVAPYTGSGHANYSYNTNNISIGADDWLFTLPVDLDASRAYSIIFQYRVKAAAYPERLEVTIGSQPTPSAQTTQLLNMPNMTNTTYAQGSQAFAVATTGTYYIGFHCYSNPFEWDLYIDSVRMRLTNNFDIALNSLQQSDGLAPAHLAGSTSPTGKQEKGVYLLDAASSVPREHVDEVKVAYTGAPISSSPEVNASILAVPTASGGPLKKLLVRSADAATRAPLPPSITLKAAVANVGSNTVPSYGLNWLVGGVLQTPYTGGTIPRFTGIDTASLSYTPSNRGTFYTQVNGVLAQDNNHSNDSATVRAKVYPLVATNLQYDLGNAAAQLRFGYDRSVGQSLTAGVRFTATQDVRLANVDVFYANKNSTGDTFQSQDSVAVKVWAAGVSDSAPGALLYTRRFAGQNYITTNPAGDAFSLPLGDDAPGFVAGSNYWVSVSFDSLIRFPMGADAKTTGRSFISPDKGATWSSLVVDAGNGPADYAWWLRCVSVPLGSISGTKFDDVNGNGVRDAGEPGLPGWTINIAGPASGSAVTDANGSYSFTNLDGGTYTASESQQSGWIETLPSASGTYTVALTTGGPNAGKDFGNFHLGSISGMKFNDLNANGAKDAGEPGVANWRIRLLRGAAQVDSALTDANGNYQFSNLTAGSYTVTEAFQSGWLQTYPASQGNHAVQVVSGSVFTGKDFGNVQASGIAGIAFRDLNANGVRDSTDAGLSGWRIRLFLDGTNIDSTLTDSGGAYVFAGLSAATYEVRESLQTAWTQSYPSGPGTHTVTLSAGGSAAGKNFGNYQLGSITGMAFNDTNGNGIKDSSEAALPGWLIRLTGPATDSMLTDGGGNFTFAGLMPGTYTLSEAFRAGWGQSTPASPATYSVILTSGSAVTGKNFGDYRFSSIAGMKFNDLNGNGLKDAGEPGVAGWLIRLSGAQSASMQTDSNGTYLFGSLRPGAYTISEATRSTWDQTYPATPGTHAVTMTDSSTVTGMDFGNFQHGSIAGVAFNDANGNGIKDSGEVGTSGWLLRLTKAGIQIDSAVTDNAGNYTFAGLSVGTYVISELLQGGWTESAPSTPGTYSVVMTSGSIFTEKNFGNFQRGSITGSAFNDLNGNGVKEIGDAALSGWRIRLSQGGPLLDSTLTDTGGNYTFTNLAPGTYAVSESLQAGWTQTFPAPPGTHAVVVTGGGTTTGRNFGNYQLGGISGTMFEDVNGNSLKDAGEPVVSGWRVRLSKEGVQLDSMLTSATGAYAFSGLSAGTYVISEVLQNGWRESLPASPGTYTVVVTTGVAVTGKDIGNFRVSTIAGSKFNDLNGNAARDAGEPGLANWRIRLFRNAQLVDSLLTAGDGSYTFTNVVPGSYLVGEAVQGGWKELLPASPGTYPLTITSGTASTGNDFGNFQLGTISGVAFLDLNGNGLLDSGEVGLSGWRIQLSLAGTPVDSTLTDSAGNYAFTGLVAGTYTVAEVLQGGWVQSAPALPGTFSVPIASGTIVTARNFGNYQPGGISGTKFQDLDGDSVKDAGENGLGGWRIRLTKNGTQIDSALTDANGNYAFVNLSPGNYGVREASQSGWLQTVPASTSGYTMTLTSGALFTGKDFGNFQLGSISGMKFLDLNGTGVKAGNGGLASWRIRLARNGTPIDSTLTDASGNYSFTGLVAGTYTVSENFVAGWTETFPASPGTYTMAITSGAVSSGIDFGNFQRGSIAGSKFLDANGNGVKDAGEPGLPNWRIRLALGGGVVDSALTDASGNYSFTNLAAGTYTVSEVSQAGWDQSMPASPGTYTVVVTSGTAATGMTFGNYQLGSISGMKFHDLNGNGVKDAGEPGLAGWQIRISGPSETSAITDTTGAYGFANLVPGTYTLSEVSESGWGETFPAPPGTYSVALASGASVTGKDFGNFRLGSIAGTVFDDLNRDSVRNAGEAGLAGWLVRLHKGTAQVDSTLTDAFGLYGFSGLTAGTYTVSEVPQAGWMQTAPGAPSTHSVSVTSGTIATGKDFGNTQIATISGMKFHDSNGDGVKDAGEPGLSGWRIRLVKGGVQVDSALTDGSGNYSFSILGAGSFTVSEAGQSGWLQTSTPASYTLSVTGGSVTQNIDFGNFQLGLISGTAFNDANDNGVRDGGEAGLANWRMRLSKGGTEVDSVLTDAAGHYSFGNLTAGTYTVSEKLRSVWVQTTTPATYVISVVGGTVATNNDFGNFQTAPEPDRTLELTALIEGFYDRTSNTMVPDTVTVELHDAGSPYGKVDQAKTVLNTAGQGTATFLVAENATPYYIVLKHRNAIETWSATPQSFSASLLAYDFTTAASKAYGNNLVLSGTKWCLYSGDCEKDGWVDGLDMNRIDNDAAQFSYGYNLSDLNGDGWTDGLDMNIVDNNSAKFIYAIAPSGASTTQPVRPMGVRKPQPNSTQKK